MERGIDCCMLAPAVFEVTLRHESVTESYAIMLSLTVSVGNFECIIYEPRLFDSAVAQLLV
jgi:hypothetical protein